MRGSHLKIGCQHIIENTLPQSQALRYGKKYPHTTSDPSIFQQMLNNLRWTTQRAKCSKRDSGTEALDNIIMVGKPEHALGALFTFISVHTALLVQGMLDTYTVSIEDYSKVSQLFEAARLKLAALWAYEKLKVMNLPLNHLMYDYKPRVFIQHHRCLTRDTVED
ncbi:hypothetical protein JCGZ_10423 [Jatropha curcas]|uniref:Uncharacterized protein n=1 Tax=Jatropha curcas TaxID=180498 RepID=A0A067KI67_JATCU|nr:hypothetical protein JCGZ_10423 [Jatropha curcas]